MSGCKKPAPPRPAPSDQAARPATVTSLAKPSGPDLQTHSLRGPLRIEHFDLDLGVSFERRELAGHVTLTLAPRAHPKDEKLVLDTRELTIDAVEISADGEVFKPTPFTLLDDRTELGRPLEITVPPPIRTVRVKYKTHPNASGLGWLEPAQTAGKKAPFMYTQSQATHARSWIPLQDTPAIRLTYTATIRVPKQLMAVMGAENAQQKTADGVYQFRMPQPIPSYLIALAVGDLTFQSLGPRSGVYAEPSMLAIAAREFEDIEKMIAAAERLYGPYEWERYDVLLLPPSFPYGGMENPRLTFATPTILAGDKSLISLIAHELAHSWSGNLVTNATWRDIWLNEGFTVYVENRIIEEIYGKEWARMETILGRQGLEEEFEKTPPESQVLHITNEAMSPEDISSVPYVKGSLFLQTVERLFGRAAFDQFLRGYFAAHAFRSITTADFAAYFDEHLLSQKPEAAAELDLESWLYGSGLPSNAERRTSSLLEAVTAQANDWTAGKVTTSNLKTARWSFHEWLHFLRALPDRLEPKQMDELANTLKLKDNNNSEIQSQWLLMSIRNDYQPSQAQLERFLMTVGRRKLIVPLYEELLKTPKGRKLAQTIFDKARASYHPIAIETLESMFKKNP